MLSSKDKFQSIRHTSLLILFFRSGGGNQGSSAILKALLTMSVISRYIRIPAVVSKHGLVLTSIKFTFI